MVHQAQHFGGRPAPVGVPRADTTKPLPPLARSPFNLFKRGRRNQKDVYEPLKVFSEKNSRKPDLRRTQPHRSSVLSSVSQYCSRTACNWWQELLAAVSLIVIFGGMVAVLRQYQDQELPDWPLGFSINTALSVFGVVFRGLLLFIASEGISQLKWHWLSGRRPLRDLYSYDQASRGAWGSLKLLWTARWRHVTALLGACITITALGVDPFTQAVVSYYGCNAHAWNATSHIGRINSFFPLGMSVTSTTASLAMDASLGNGLALLPNYTCSVTNCTFAQPYHTIGMCSSCSDMTDQLEKNCTEGVPGLGIHGEGGGCTYTISNNSTNWNASASYNTVTPNLNYNGPVDSDQYMYEWNLFGVNRYAVGLPRDAGDMPYRTTQIDFVSGLPVLGCRCSLYYCVRSYTATIQGGVLQENLVSTSSNWSSYSHDTAALGTVRVDCLTPPVQSRLLSDGVISHATEWMAWNGTYLGGSEADERISSSPDLAIPARCAYQMLLVDKLMEPRPSETWSSLVNGTLRGEGSNTQVIADTSSSDLLMELYKNGSVTVDTISAALDNFTEVVSNYLRTQNSPVPANITPYTQDGGTGPHSPFPKYSVQGVPDDWNQPLTGQGFVSSNCVHIRWPWLSLPAALVVATLVFLFALIIQTAPAGDKQREVWKSSQDALIWHGLDGPAEHESAILNTSTEMKQRAKELVVQLQPTRRGWKLVEADAYI